MRFRRTITAVSASAAVAGMWLPAQAAQAAPGTHYYTLRINAIDRAGHGTPIQPVVVENGLATSGNGQVFKVTAGRYLVAAAVPTPIPNSSEPSLTMIAETVTVSRNTTVILDARKGKLLKVAFNVPGAQQVFQGGALCDGLVGIGGMLAGVYDDPTGTTYVAPLPKGVTLFWQSRWQSANGTLYDLAGSGAAGSKAAPDFTGRLSELAKVNLQLRTGTSAAGASSGVILDQGANCEPGGDLLQVNAPWGAIDYMQAGAWAAQVNIGARSLWWNGGFKAGHSYSLDFGAAVAGPWLPSITGPLFPEFNGQQLAFGAEGLIGDPVAQSSSDCSGRVTTTLIRGSRVLKTTHGDLCGGGLDARLASSGWYRLQVTGTQASELSTKVTLNWRFYARTGPEQSWPEAFPVTLTEFRADGLNLENAAAPGAQTRIVAQIVKGAYPDSPTPRNVLNSVRILASFDGGTTWQSLRLARSGNYWIAEITDPASGFVSLRSVVTNTAGDSSTQTIYNAYAIG